MLTFSTENTLSLEPKSPLGSFACSTIYISTYFSAVAGVCAHKTTPFMQNKANFRRDNNDCNLSYNKHLRRKTTPGGAKKQSQFKTNWQKGRDPCQTSPNTSYQFRAKILRAYKAPLAGFLRYRPPARTKQYLLCKTKPISGGIIMTVTSATTSTYEEKPPLEAPKNKANFKPSP